MRCKACDAKFTDVDLARTNPHTGEPEDMCGVCLKAANVVWDNDDKDDDVEFPGTSWQEFADEWDD